jgi:hypothetical protein
MTPSSFEHAFDASGTSEAVDHASRRSLVEGKWLCGLAAGRA